MSFEGKYFIITGAAGAIAEPLIERLYSQKANLLLIDVKEDNYGNLTIFCNSIDETNKNSHFRFNIFNNKISFHYDSLDVYTANYTNKIVKIEYYNDTLYSIAGSYNSNNNNIVLIKQENENKIFTYLGDTANRDILFNAIFENNSIIINGLRNQVTSNDFFIRKYSLQGNLIEQNNFSIVSPNLFFKSSFGYTVINNTDKIYLFNDSLTNDSVFNVDYDNNISFPPKFSNGSLTLNDEIFLNATKKYWNGTINTEDDYTSTILYKYKNNELINLFEDTLLSNGSNSLSNGFYTIDAIDTNKIYFAFMNGDCPFVNFPLSNCYNDIIVYCADINGNLFWSKKVGGDAKYHIYKIIATIDNGLLIIAGRYHPNLTENENEDLYYIKFDMQGNIQNNFYTSNIEVINNKITIYPNPTKNYININYKDIQLTDDIKLFDKSGKEVKCKFKIENNVVQINLSFLAKGVYYIYLRDKNDVYHSKTIVLE